MDFLFLSKLLPLFFYPLGLIFLLLIISLILWWKYPRWLPIPVIFACLILFIGSNVWVSNLLVKSLEWQYISPPDKLPNVDAIVVLGGGIKPRIYPRAMIDVADGGDRVIYSAKLYKMGKSPLIIPTGGRISWGGGENLPSEADDMTELLLLLGVPESAIIKEGNSFNTYDNAVNTRQILQKLKINRVLLVTSALHMPRSVKIFEKQNIEVIPAPTDYLVTKKDFQEDTKESKWQDTLLNFFPDSNSLNNTTLAIKEYIGMVVYKLKGWL
ncbi:YdcF family protein [Geminocystis sp. NIES-3709]|uniref:YdcF family protein n=1 Tax=Geminocystis sp. NIES-3709 TaxID=1617448 RepID=UPI0005FC8C87|nr:YdcF family protein [Geminocystis sp. NIES-3709]BAQ64293.1 putative membrane protein [Geminocystis sp. NIES-3709]